MTLLGKDGGFSLSRPDVDPGESSGNTRFGPTRAWNQSDSTRMGAIAQHSQEAPQRRDCVTEVPTVQASPTVQTGAVQIISAKAGGGSAAAVDSGNGVDTGDP